MPDGDPLDFSGQYNTALAPDQEAAFQAWTRDQTAKLAKTDHPRNVANDSYDYDLRGWYAQNGSQDLSDAHLTDQFKKPNHPTFSDQSQYSGVDGYQGGQWQQNGNAWSFTPGKGNVYSPEDLQDYFKRVEPGNTVNLPQGGQQ